MRDAVEAGAEPVVKLLQGRAVAGGNPFHDRGQIALDAGPAVRRPVRTLGLVVSHPFPLRAATGLPVLHRYPRRIHILVRGAGTVR